MCRICAAILHPSMGSGGTRWLEMETTFERSRIDVMQMIDIVAPLNYYDPGSIPGAAGSGRSTTVLSDVAADRPCGKHRDDAGEQ